MRVIDEISNMVKSAAWYWPFGGQKPQAPEPIVMPKMTNKDGTPYKFNGHDISYGKNGAIDWFATQGFKRGRNGQYYADAPDPEVVRLFQNRRMQDLQTSPNSAQAGPSGPFRNWQGWQSAKSTQMKNDMKRMRIITEGDAYNEILKRKPGIDPQNARYLARMVAKNYRIDSNGKWMNMNGDSGNMAIANRFRKMQRQNTMLAGSGASAPGYQKS